MYGFFSFLGALFVIAGYYLLLSEAATSSSTTSNVTIASSIGLTLSGNLSAGIYFGNTTVGTNDNNGSANYIYNDSVYSGRNTSAYWIQMASSNNGNVDTCISANTDLTSGTNVLGVGNITYNANSSKVAQNIWNQNNASTGVLITTTSTKFGNLSLVPNSNQTLVFHLDIPSQQITGTYNNTITFSIVTTGSAC